MSTTAHPVAPEEVMTFLDGELCQDEKVGYLAADPSGRNRRVRRGTGGSPDLKVLLPFHCGIVWGRGRALTTDEVRHSGFFSRYGLRYVNVLACTD